MQCLEVGWQKYRKKNRNIEIFMKTIYRYAKIEMSIINFEYFDRLAKRTCIFRIQIFIDMVFQYLTAQHM